jgi:nitrite reductase/ring-hydroxylating ferredoxin subunit
VYVTTVIKAGRVRWDGVSSKETGGSPNRREREDYVVCDLHELPPGSVKIVPVGKFGVGIFNVHGELYALTNYCMHEGGPLCIGRIQGTNAVGTTLPARTEYVMDGRIVRCPWHGWEFDITTGRALADPQRRIRSYEVRVEDGKVVLSR